MFNESQLNEIYQLLKLSFSLNTDERKKAENYLLSIEHKGLALLLLKILDQFKDISVSQAAAIYFKNLILKNWHLNYNDSKIKMDERLKIKEVIVQLMLKSNDNISMILKVAIQEICKYDYPDKWKSLLPNLITKLSSKNYKIHQGVLSILNSMFEKFRHIRRSPKTDKELLYCSKILIEPLTGFYGHNINSVISSINAQNCNLLCLILRLFNSLICHELLAEIEEISHLWMNGFIKLLQMGVSNSFLFSVNSEIFKILVIFCNKYDDCENYKNNQNKFIEISFNILSKTNDDKKFDDLIINGIIYFTSIIKKPWNKNLFSSYQTLNNICKKIVFPNIYLRQSDIEEFDFNPMEYYRKDMENSICLSKKSSAFDLIQAMNKINENDVCQIIMKFVNDLENEYKKDKIKNWPKKNASLFLIVSICVKGKTERHGVVNLVKNFDYQKFIMESVIPELTNKNENYIFLADCLKILILFRSHIVGDKYIETINLLSSYLGSRSNVLNMYASRGIEKYYVLKNNEGTFILNINHIKQLSKEILKKLFNVLNISELFGNEIIMRAITIVLSRLGKNIKDIFNAIFDCIFNNFCKMIKNQTNGQFNHYIFESIAAIIYGCSDDVEMLILLENKFIPVFERILLNPNLSDFYGYIFQIISQFLSYNDKINSKIYFNIIPLFITPSYWIELVNVKPLTNLIKIILTKSPQYLNSKLENLLGLFQRLLSQKSNDYHSFDIFLTICCCYDTNILSKYFPTVIKLICIKLEKDRSIRFVSKFVNFFCSFCALVTFDVVYDVTESIQKNMTKMILEKIIIPNSINQNDSNNRKSIVVGLISIISSEKFLSFFGDDLLVKMIKIIIQLIELPPILKLKRNCDEELEDLERAGYSAQYSNLIFVKIKLKDPLTKFKDNKKLLALGLQMVSKKYPNRIGLLIDKKLNEKEKKTLFGYFTDAKVSLY